MAAAAARSHGRPYAVPAATLGISLTAPYTRMQSATLCRCSVPVCSLLPPPPIGCWVVLASLRPCAFPLLPFLFCCAFLSLLPFLASFALLLPPCLFCCLLPFAFLCLFLPLAFCLLRLCLSLLLLLFLLLCFLLPLAFLAFWVVHCLGFFVTVLPSACAMRSSLPYTFDSCSHATLGMSQKVCVCVRARAL